ncbi:NAD(P)/FAD-dependent oxidoreductase [Tropicimonas sp. IMCC6043]|uniref:NAD(P)/FAD-dependent oxidoreductase n=1 Tax=Tropicimonas sp. IMCC6043 TaxID=2510645 RepID=UPI00101C50C9|nr:FAD-dependent oxidoreductase [Tropicimonas sp. IMCC6043]RYH09650.1 FAD-dependent oxidoreductase [Tropicimonas sp. IMCC6043]
MPLDSGGPGPRRIAVIGAGISGMGAAHLLAGMERRQTVVLFEAEGRLGGHARTRLAGRTGTQPVDTGFIVFNHATYPRLTELFARLGVETAASDMTFGASIDGGRIEYGLRNLSTLFAQKRNLGRPAFLRMVADLIRFNRQADAAARDPETSVDDLLGRLRMGPWFRDYYLAPITGAIWSTPVDRALDFPARAMIDFFRNHALLHHAGQHQWYTVKGGSVEYVRRLTAEIERQGVEIRRACPVETVRRGNDGVEIRAGGAWERFDDVIFATHADDTLRLLGDASPKESAELGAIRYQPNEVVLHSDASVMPRRKSCWSAWNYAEETGARSERISLTYWMNALQPIPADDPLFVTLNPTRAIDPARVFDRTVMRHPVYDLDAFRGKAALAARNGARRTWFCGAWMGNGFHEDGLASAHSVVEAMQARDTATDPVA